MTISIKPTASGSTIEQDGSTVLSVESDRSVDIDSGTLHVDATNNRVGINTSSPASSLHIDQGSGGEGLRFERDTYDTVDIELSESGLRFRNETDGRTDLFLDGSGNFKFNSGYGSVATAYGCRAWVNFNGTGTVAIRASGNVSSITDNGTGDYTMNFSTSMPDVNYCVQTTVEPESAYPNHVRMSGVYYNTRATGSVRLRTGGVPSELGPDPFGFFAVIFR